MFNDYDMWKYKFLNIDSNLNYSFMFCSFILTVYRVEVSIKLD